MGAAALTFDDPTRKRCISLHGIDPEHSYREMMLEIRVGGPALYRITRALGNPPTQSGEPLSPMQQQTLILAAAGLSTEEIADAQVLATETVKHHRKIILKKLGARNITHAVALFLTSHDDAYQEAA